jgi:hypothetical protein
MIKYHLSILKPRLSGTGTQNNNKAIILSIKLKKSGQTPPRLGRNPRLNPKHISTPLQQFIRIGPNNISTHNLFILKSFKGSPMFASFYNQTK